MFITSRLFPLACDTEHSYCWFWGCTDDTKHFLGAQIRFVLKCSAPVHCCMKASLFRQTNLNSVNETTNFVIHFINNFSWSAIPSQVLNYVWWECTDWQRPSNLCLPFSWDWTNFLLSSWYRTLFWVQYNVSNTLMLWLVFSSACPNRRTFWGLVLCQWGGE